MDGKSEMVLIGNLIVVKFNYDMNCNQEFQIYIYVVVINVMQNGDKWQFFGIDKIGKIGFIENVYVNQIVFGKFYWEVFKFLVEKFGYEMEVVGKYGMWEMKGVFVELFFIWFQEVREVVGFDVFLKLWDVVVFDICKLKEVIDLVEKMVEWMNMLKEIGFDIWGYCEVVDV